MTRNESWCTPIHQAAHHGHLHCLKFLIQQAPPNAVHLWDNDCNTPTLLAIQVGGAGQGGEVGRAERGGGRGGVGRWEGRDEEGQRLICATCVRPCVTQD